MTLYAIRRTQYGSQSSQVKARVNWDRVPFPRVKVPYPSSGFLLSEMISHGQWATCRVE